jgi:hypothetical protein
MTWKQPIKTSITAANITPPATQPDAGSGL